MDSIIRPNFRTKVKPQPDHHKGYPATTCADHHLGPDGNNGEHRLAEEAAAIERRAAGDKISEKFLKRHAKRTAVRASLHVIANDIER